jgi:ribonucleoside-diphosphate reductase beta chain
MLVVLVDTDAFHGSYTKSPFNFKNYKLSEAKVTAGGHNYPNTPLKANFESKQYLELFNNLFEVLGIGDENKGNGITKEKFVNGSMILAFDLSPDCDDGGHWELIKQGTTSLHLTFDEAIPAGGVEAIVYSEYDNMLSIDRNRQPSFDYAF